MDNIIYLQSEIYKSMLLRDKELWLSDGKEADVEKFEKAIQKKGLFNDAHSIPLHTLYKIHYNETLPSKIHLSYTDIKDEWQDIEIDFDNTAKGIEFAEYLAQKNRMSKTVEEENKTQKLVINMAGAILAAALSLWLGIYVDPARIDENTGGLKRKRYARLLKFIYDTIGQKGLLLIGLAIFAVLVYRAYKQYHNPGNVVSYNR